MTSAYNISEILSAQIPTTYKWAQGDGVYYVSKSGSDSNDGRSPWTAKATITAALQTAGSDSTIYVARGIYQETVVLGATNGCPYRVSLVGLGGRPSYNSGVVVRPPSSTADGIVCSGSQMLVENIGVCGYESGGTTTWTGNGFRNAAVGYDASTDSSRNIYRNIWVQNKDNTATDGSNGGTGILHEGGEECLYEWFYVQETNLGLYIHAPGAGTVANNAFFRGQLQVNWRDLEKSTGTTGDTTNNLFMQIKGYGERCPRASGNIVDLLQDAGDTGGGSSTYISCTFGEDSGGSQIYISDHGNTFIGCANAPNGSNIVVDGSGNRFIELTNQNALLGVTLNGNNNTIEGAHETNGSHGSQIITVNGANNRLRYVRGSAIMDAGTNTLIEDCDQTSVNTGAATIPAGSTSVVVTHGLAFTPTRPQSQIVVTSTNNPTNDPGNLWVSNVGATQITINCRNDPGAGGLSCAWTARY